MRIGKYTVASTLYESPRTVVYRVFDGDGKFFIVKTTSENANVNDVNKLYQEFVIAKKLDEKYTSAYIELIEDDRVYIVKADEEGKKLLEIIPSDGIDLGRFFEYGLSIIDALASLHEKKVLYLDLNPSNIMCDEETRSVKFFDFGISVAQTGVAKVVKNTTRIEGTVAYISPEQTGLINQGIDERSDFYAVGVVFFEMLCGRVPFVGGDTLETIHSHFAKLPPEPHTLRSDVPSSLSKLILKLLSKDKEDRYQTIDGLRYDFVKISQNKDMQFTLGQMDFSGKLLIPQRLYGREKELELAKTKILSSIGSDPKIIMVKGYSGIGKTSFVNELRPIVVQKNGYFVKGKFDQYNKTTSYVAFLQVFRGLLSIVNEMPHDKKEQILSNMTHVLGESCYVLTKIMPELESIFRAEPSSQLSHTQLKNQLSIAMERFIGFFASPEHPLVVFLDDMQWADGASLEMLELIFASGQLNSFLIIGAYRDNEVNDTHPMMLTLDNISGRAGEIDTILLAPLDMPAVSALLKDTFRRNDVGELAHILIQKTDGNPFFLRQFIDTLLSRGLLAFDKAHGLWDWSIKKIKDEGLTSNVVEHLVSKITSLPADVQEFLKTSAVVGDKFEVDTVCELCGFDINHGIQTVELLIEQGLIESTAEQRVVKDENSDSLSLAYVKCRFIHDRIRQAAYSLLSDDERVRKHAQIARTLIVSGSYSGNKKSTLYAANHVMQSIRLFVDDEHSAIMNLLFEAAMYAKEALAYRETNKYIEAAISLLPSECWSKAYTFTFKLYKELVESLYLGGDYDGATLLFEEILSKQLTTLDTAYVYNLRLMSHFSRSMLAEAVNDGLRALSLLGEELPNATDALTELKKSELEWLNLNVESIESLSQLPTMEDEKIELAMHILVNMGIPAFVSRQDMFGVIALKMAKLSIQYGNCSVSSYGYTLCGMIIGAGLGRYEDGYRYGNVGLVLQDRFNNKSIECKLLRVYGAYIASWFEPHEKTLEILRRAYRSGIENGDFPYAAYCLNHIFTREFLLDMPLDTLEKKTIGFTSFLMLNKDRAMFELQILLANVVKCLEGKTLAATLFSTDEFDENESLEYYKSIGFNTLIAYFYIYKLQVCYFHGEFSKAKEYALLAKNYLGNIKGNILESEWAFYYALTIFAIDDEENERGVIEELMSRFEAWGRLSAKNFLAKAVLLKAVLASKTGQGYHAAELFEQAISIQDDSLPTLLKALSLELSAKHWYTAKNMRIAKSYIHEAYAIYHTMRANVKSRHLVDTYGESLRNEIYPRTMSTSIDALDHDWNLLDEETISRASILIASKVNRKELIEKLMFIMAQGFGAQIGGLILNNEDGVYLDGLFDANKEPKVNIFHIPFEECITLPKKIVGAVLESKKSVILDSAVDDEYFSSDPVVQERHIYSLICMPFFLKEKLAGLVYMENALAKGFFNLAREKILNILMSQAAVSLENAQLFEKMTQNANALSQLNKSLEDMVAEETKKRLEAEKSLLNQSKMAMMGEMIGAIAHQWRQPLNSLGLSIQDVVEAKKFNELDAEYLEKFKTNSMAIIKQMSETIEDFRNFFKPSKEKSTFCVEEAIENTLSIVSAQFKNNFIDINFLQTDKHYFHGYKSEFEQVALNILSNAKDAILDSDNSKNGKVNISVKNIEGGIAIEFYNNGKAIPKDLLDRIFEPYFTTKEQGKGTGIGLHMSREIIERHLNGKISAKNTEDGVCFTVVLPIEYKE